MWLIFPLSLSITLYSGELMQAHPLIAVFKEKKEITKLESFVPLNEGAIVQNIVPSSDFKKMGCLVLAGGQGTRLGVDGPKGCVELPLQEKKTLFELIFEKVKEKGRDLSLAVMTSPVNHEATVRYFEENDYFGLTNVSVFPQEMMPVCDEEGNLYEGMESPDGNGKALKNLYDSGVWKLWKGKGVEVVQVIPVDNPKAEPFDGELLAVHEKQQVDLVLKCIRRDSPKEKLGVIGEERGKLMIREYSELTERMQDLGFPLGNTGLFSCSMDFAARAARVELPWHLAHKQAGDVWIWKFETFIFDLFPYANSFKVIISERKNCFAPLKNRSGPDSLETVAKALMT